MQIYGYCAGCKRKRFFVKKKRVQLPIGITATSKDLYCPRHFKGLQEAIISDNQ